MQGKGKDRKRAQRPPALREGALQDMVIGLARACRWRYYHTHDSRRSVAGFPDLVLVRPPAVLFVELKGTGGRASLEQREWLAALKQCPGVQAYLWGPDEWRSGEIERVLTGRSLRPQTEVQAMKATTYGDVSDTAKQAQELLRALGFYTMDVDGDYGNGTRGAVYLFREEYMREARVTGADLDYMRELIQLRTDAHGVAAAAGGQWPAHPATYAELSKVFGSFDKTPIPGQPGWVKPTNPSKEYRIVSADLPIVGKKTVHALIVDPLRAFLSFVEAAGLAKELGDIGTYAVRHIGRDPKRPLSIHSWGCAFDIMPRENPMGIRGLISQRIVLIAEAMGWQWGGRWGATKADKAAGLDGNLLGHTDAAYGGGKDDMHFEWVWINRTCGRSAASLWK